MIPKVATEGCTGCTRCREVCPPLAIHFEDGKACIEEEFCEECGFCAAECPSHAILLVFPVAG